MLNPPKEKYSPSTLPLPLMMLSGGLAGCVAEVLTIPLDTVKVRLQIQGEGLAKGQPLKYRGVVGTLATVAREEGPLVLFKGLSAGLQRQIVFASLRIGLYEPVRNFLVKDPTQPISIGYKILAGLITGAFGIMVANPTDIVKIRFQAEGKKPPEQRRYKGIMDAYRQIYRTEGGLMGFWIGIVPNIFRNSIINATELATYDQAK
jgi:solute carrier family 25 uncoupling protein 8/9